MRYLPSRLTRTQEDVLRFVMQYIRSNCRPPSVAEVSAQFGWRSPNASHVHLNALKKKGYLDNSKELSGVSRGLMPVRHPDGRPVRLEWFTVEIEEVASVE